MRFGTVLIFFATFAAILPILLIATLYLGSSGESNSGNIEMLFFDVGQGDSTLVRVANKTVLIDCGNFNAGEKILSELKANSVTAINVLIATHPDSDHIGGCFDVIRNFNVSLLLQSPILKRKYDDLGEKLNDIAMQHSIPIAFPSSGEKIFLDDNLGLTVLSPPAIFASNEDNENSLVLRGQFKKFSFLLAADAERQAENFLVENFALHSTVLRIGHHGSKTSTSERFLTRVSPRLAIISVGENNYGHPHKAILQRLSNSGIAFLRTDTNGTVRLVSDGRDFLVTSGN